MKWFIVLLVVGLPFIAIRAQPPKVTTKSKEIEAHISAVKNIVVFEVNDQRGNTIVLDDDESVKATKVYYLGTRIAGDNLVAVDGYNMTWPSPHDVVLKLTYPRSGVGAVVTYVQITVVQSTNVGKAVLVAGGIGQRFFQINVEAYSTYLFNYSLQVYGLL
ncbi:uncharacterized protein LOC131425321 [Malaya genurostris]|uniref:uncharacterized protein LOC131425321 n=1 Tax=Malaya genurostris TaxID=325434 RepID=UPI0026F40936|nr:uncharacterized protein LOC131425321 [Malaya genurostris]